MNDFIKQKLTKLEENHKKVIKNINIVNNVFLLLLIALLAVSLGLSFTKDIIFIELAAFSPVIGYINLSRLFENKGYKEEKNYILNQINETYQDKEFEQDNQFMNNNQNTNNKNVSNKLKILKDELKMLKINRREFIKKYEKKDTICKIIEIVSGILTILVPILSGLPLDIMGKVFIITILPGVVSAFYKLKLDNDYEDTIEEFRQDIIFKRIEIDKENNRRKLFLEDKIDYEYSFFDTENYDIIKENDKGKGKRLIK